MKYPTLAAFICLASLGGTGWSAAFADDRGLQAILAKQSCVPVKISGTDLSPVVTAYEIACKGRGHVLTVVCMEQDCQLQPKSHRDNQDEER